MPRIVLVACVIVGLLLTGCSSTRHQEQADPVPDSSGSVSRSGSSSGVSGLGSLGGMHGGGGKGGAVLLVVAVAAVAVVLIGVGIVTTVAAINGKG